MKSIRPIARKERGIELADAMAYWRTIGAGEIRSTHRRNLERCLGALSAVDLTLRSAINGDPESAVWIAMARHGDETTNVDLAMTALLRCALDDEGASAVLAHRIATSSLTIGRRDVLVSSWSGSRRKSRRRRRTGGASS